MVIEKVKELHCFHIHTVDEGITIVPLHMFIYVIIYLMSVFPDKSQVRNTVFTTVSPVYKVPSGGSELFDE